MCDVGCRKTPRVSCPLRSPPLLPAGMHRRSDQRHQRRPASPLPPRWQTSPSCPSTVRSPSPSPPMSWPEETRDQPPSTPRTPCPPSSPPPLPTSPATSRGRRTSSAPLLLCSASASALSQLQRFNADSLHLNVSKPPCLVEFSGRQRQMTGARF